ncbi:MAG: DUF3352 domain-containing protein [Chlorobi bacterium]|nr:DUF3352 domain-containing protein [Chlorobiota bacterium]
MFKKILSVLFVIVVIGTITAGYFYLKNKNKPIPPLIKAIPIDASFFIKGDNFIQQITNLNQHNEIIKELKGIKEFSEFTTNLGIIDSVAFNNKELTNQILSKPFAISAHYAGRNTLDFLYVFRLTKLIDEKLALNTLISLFNNISGKGYEKTKIYSVEIKTKSQKITYYFSITSGLVLISKSEILVESAVRQINISPSIDDLQGFKNVYSTAGENVDANLYINFKQLKKTLSLAINSKISNYLLKTNYFANWAELDVNFQSESILLNGFTYSNDSLKLFMNTFSRQNAHKNDLQDIFPSNTASFTLLNIDDYSLYLHNYLKNLNKQSKVRFKNSRNQIQTLSNIDINENFTSFFDNQIAIVNTDISNIPIEQNTFVVIKTTSKSKALEKLEELNKAYSKEKNISLNHFKTNYSLDKETKFTAYKMVFSQYAFKMFGGLFMPASCNYFCFIDNNLVFAHSPQMLKMFVHANLLHKNLVNEQRYKSFYDNLSSKSNFYFYCNISKSEKYIKKYMSNSFFNILSNNTEKFNKFQAIGFQFTNSRNMYYNNVFLKYNPVFKNKSQTLWESRLDTSVVSKPSLVINHYTSEKEIFVQDISNTIYLINNKGRILWKKKLNEKIQSRIHQIDYYKNGKLQYLFNTKSKIYLIDRNGNFVERYPIVLNSEATNALNVFDYAHNKNYRIFIALKNKKVKVFNKEGNVVTGWKFLQTEHLVKKEIKYFRIENKDYIVFSDSMRIYILNRKGQERVVPEKQISLSYHNNFILEKKNIKTQNRLIVTDNTGMIYFIYFNGKVETLNTGHYSPEHYFEFQDIDGDYLRDFIFVDNSELTVLNRNNKKIYTYSFKSNINNPPLIFTFPKKGKKIGILSEEEHQIYLLNKDGSNSKGFPLTGISLFSIGKLQPNQEKYNLIVGGEDNFLYNYYLH